MTDSLEAVEGALQLSLLPSIVMLAMSFAVYGVEPSENMMAAFQHLAAGIVLSAVAVELMPLIMDSPNDIHTIAGIVGGFLTGIATFIAIGTFCGAEEEDTDAADGKVAAEDGGETDRLGELSEKLLFNDKMRRTKSDDDPPARQQISQSFSNSHGGPVSTPKTRHPRSSSDPSRTPKTTHTHTNTKLAAVRACRDCGAAVPPYPTALVVAVFVDATVDGFLIGLASANSARANAGLVLALALSIEMGFLGLTFGATMRKQPSALGVPSVLAPPLLLLLGAAVGACASAALAAYPALHVALVAFGAAALLYLVTEELLLEAHAGADEHVWWVDLQFFLGFLASFLLEKATSAD